MSALDNLGPHLLGRVPSPVDYRDWRLEDHFETLSNPQIAALIQQGVDYAKLTTVGYAGHSVAWQNNQTTNWWKSLDQFAQAEAALGSAPPPPAPTGDVKWADAEAVLDQGQFGTCVGNGTAQFLNTLPYDDKFTEGMGQPATTKGPYARAVYYEATVLDGSPDDPNASGGGQQGASVRSGMKALANRGRLAGGYAVTGQVSTIRAWVQSKGPVVMGTNWYNDMFNPVNGVVTPTGGIAGGHCWLIAGDLVSESHAWCLNSWSAGWGLGGYFKLAWSDVQALLNQNGEAWTAVELPV